MRRLRILKEVASRGSYSAAADALGYTPSAISQQMATLERETASALVLRSSKGVQLTDAGRVLLRHTDSILAQMAEAEAELEAIRGVRAGRLRIAAFATAAATIVPLAIAEYRRLHPAVALTLMIAEQDEAIAGLRGGEFDIVLSLVESDAEAGPLEAVHLLDDPMLVALPRGHRLAHRRLVALSELRDEPWMVGTSSTCPDNANFTRACTAAGFQPRISFENDDYSAVQGLVAAGVGVALIPDMAAVNVRDDIVLRGLGAGTPMREVFALTLPGAERAPAIAAMLATLIEASRDWSARRSRIARPPRVLAS